MPKVLFFVSPIGLGHASRGIAIADELVRMGMSRDEIIFVTGGVAYSYLRDHDYNAIEGYRRKSIDASNGIFKNKLLWLLDYISFYKECKSRAYSMIEEYRPELVVSDEDFASISVAEVLGIKNVLITDVFESKFLNGLPSILERILNRYLRDIIARADMVIVPMHYDEVEEKYEHLHAFGNLVYVGPIVRRVSRCRDLLRKEFGFDGYRVILVTVGGTKSGRFLIEKAIDAYTMIVDDLSSSIPPTKLVMVSGPSIDIQDMRNVHEGIEFHDYVKNMHEMVYAADLLISLAGRSTMDEARVYGTPAILIPIKGHFEQENNARIHGFSHDDVERLKHLMLEYLACERREVRGSDGASKASSMISRLLT